MKFQDKKLDIRKYLFELKIKPQKWDLTVKARDPAEAEEKAKIFIFFNLDFINKNSQNWDGDFSLTLKAIEGLDLIESPGPVDLKVMHFSNN